MLLARRLGLSAAHISAGLTAHLLAVLLTVNELTLLLRGLVSSALHVVRRSV